jgi:HAD superfamily hydrolase (TIGR01450 family)
VTFVDRYDAFLFDLDGVVWRGEEPVPGAVETIARLREMGKNVVFVTNNASRTPRDYAAKLIRMQIPTESADIVTSAHAVVEHLRTIGVRKDERVHVCGTAALSQLLQANGFEPTTDTTDVKALVVAWDPQLTFEEIRRAADLARAGIPFIAANRDATYPSEDGLLPGTGAIVAAIEVASGVAATVVGKPRPEVIKLALERTGAAADRALFLGDRVDSDIVGARAAGVPVALVLTGVTTREEADVLSDRPDRILEGLADLFAPEPASAEVVVDAGDPGAPGLAEGDDEDQSGDESADVGEVRYTAARLDLA